MMTRPWFSMVSSISVSLSSAGAFDQVREAVSLSGLRQAHSVKQRGQQHQRIPGQHGVTEAAIPEAGNQEDEARDQQARSSAP